jgi:hypothetical protein
LFTSFSDNQATLLHVSDDRTSFVIHYICEPVLARGALNVLLKDNSTQIQVLWNFQQLLQRADLGSRGEVAAELVCLLLQKWSAEKFEFTINLTEFLQKLLIDECPESASQVGVEIEAHEQSLGDGDGDDDDEDDEEVVDKRPFNVAALVQSVFGDQTPIMNLVQFRYFDRHITRDDLAKCYDQGVGIIMVTNAAALDFVIPLKLESSGVYSAVIIQVKNLSESSPVSARHASGLLNKIGYQRIFKSMTDDQFRETPASPDYNPTVPVTKRAKTSETAVPRAASASASELISSPPATASKSKKRKAPEPADALPPSPPFCKLLFLMRDASGKSNSLQKSPVSEHSSTPENSLEGVLRGLPKVFSPGVRSALSDLVADFRSRRFRKVDELEAEDFRRQFVNQVFPGVRRVASSTRRSQTNPPSASTSSKFKFL